MWKYVVTYVVLRATLLPQCEVKVGNWTMQCAVAHYKTDTDTVRTKPFTDRTTAIFFLDSVKSYVGFPYFIPGNRYAVLDSIKQ